jgi:hypothetical protein
MIPAHAPTQGEPLPGPRILHVHSQIPGHLRPAQDRRIQDLNRKGDAVPIELIQVAVDPQPIVLQPPVPILEPDLERVRPGDIRQRDIDHL